MPPEGDQENYKITITYKSGRVQELTVASDTRPEVPTTGDWWKLGDITIRLDAIEQVEVKTLP
jgi:hypothetical protein